MAQPLKRTTRPTKRVLAAIMQDPAGEFYGLDIATATGLKSGSLYPILMRLEELGWLTSRWEEIDPGEQERPRRRYYQLTGAGIDLARETLADTPPATWLVPKGIA